MAESKKTSRRFDPYKNFKFRVVQIVPKATRADIRLAESELALLDQIVEQNKDRHSVGDRPSGAAHALFVGDKGTGKGMAGEVVANQLGLNVYRIDLSEVVSKYIGETEKNLDQILDSAEESGAILYLDEAEALFGKRTDVKDSHERYANIEVNYLLQRLETHKGLVIFATSRKGDIDEAFLRRLRFVVQFSSERKG